MQERKKPRSQEQEIKNLYAKELEELLELEAHGEIFEEKYTSTNKQRFSFISYYKHIAGKPIDSFMPPLPEVDKEEADEEFKVDENFLWLKSIHIKKQVLKGLIVFEIQTIAAEKRWTPTIQTPLYIPLKEALKINSRDDLSYIDKLIYLSALRKYICEHDFETIKNNEQWENKEKLLHDIDIVFGKVVNKLETVLQGLMEGPPTLQVLEERFKAISKKYFEILNSRSYVSWFFSSSDRSEQCKLIDWIDKTFDSLRKAGKKEELYELISAVLVHLAIEINKYQYARSANGRSDFYDMLMDALNVLYLHNIDPVKKTGWLTKLILHVESLETKTKYEADEIKKLVAKIREDIKVMAHEPRNNPSGYERAAQYIENRGYKCVIEEGGGVLSNLGTAGIVGAAGTAGFFMGGPVGAIVAANVAGFASKTLIQPLIVMLINKTVSSGTYLASKTYKKLLTDPTPEGIDALKDVYSKTQPPDPEVDQMCELIRAVLEIPDHLFSKELKEKILNTQLSERAFMKSKGH